MRSGSGRRRKLLFAALLASLAFLAHRSSGAPTLGEDLLRSLIERPMEALLAWRAAASDRLSEMRSHEDLRERIRSLEEEQARLRLRLAELAEVERENRRLSDLLVLRERSRIEARAARVIASTAAGTSRSLVVDVGARDGAARDAVVFGLEGVVGRILKVGPRTSVAQLLTERTSGMGALIARSRVQGVLVGDGQRSCRLRYVPNQEDVKEGDEVQTSGLDGIYPKGIPVGRVSRVAAGYDAFQEILVEPAVDLDRLETVLVALKASSAGSETERAELAALGGPRETDGAAPARSPRSAAQRQQ